MRNVRIATASFLLDDEEHTFEKNFQRIADYAAMAQKRGADVLCFPEAVITANVHPDFRYAGEKYPGMFTRFFTNIAREHRLNIIAPYIVYVGKRLYNQALVLDSRGKIMGAYRKVQLTAEESAMISSGDKLPVFRLPFGRIAVMLCLDVYFPEIARIYAMKGAEIIFWPTATHGPTQESLLVQGRARALDNSIVVVESNYAGHPPYAPYAGRSRPATARIIDHHGDVIAQTGRRHGIAVADIDLDEVRLTSGCVLAREPDHIKDDLAALARFDLYAKEYIKLGQRKKKK